MVAPFFQKHGGPQHTGAQIAVNEGELVLQCVNNGLGQGGLTQLDQGVVYGDPPAAYLGRGPEPITPAVLGYFCLITDEGLHGHPPEAI